MLVCSKLESKKSHGNLWRRASLANKARTKLYATYLLLQPPPVLPLLLTSHATSNRMRIRWNLCLERNKKISFHWRNIWLNYRLQYIPLGCILRFFIANDQFYCQIAFYCTILNGAAKNWTVQNFQLHTLEKCNIKITDLSIQK